MAKINLPKLDSTVFTWQRWRGMSYAELDLVFKTEHLLSYRAIWTLKKYVVGWCHSYNLQCRPKIEGVALMCFKNEEHFWFHLRQEEFNKIFKK